MEEGGGIFPRPQLEGSGAESGNNSCLLIKWPFQSPPPAFRHSALGLQRGGRNCCHGLRNGVGQGQRARLWAASFIFPDSCTASRSDESTFFADPLKLFSLLTL